MAEYALIDIYLERLRARLRWRRDAEDLVAEVEDHLFSTVERLEVAGADAESAELMTLDRFGDPRLVAEAFASTPRGGLAMPTSFTKTAGTLAIVAGALWLVVAGAWWLAAMLGPNGDVDGNASAVAWGIGWVALLAAGTLIVGVASGLSKRHGGLGALGSAGTVSFGIGVVGSVVAWVFVGWGLLMTVGTLLVAAAMLARDIAPRLPTLALGGALTVGAIVWAVARALEGTLLRYDGLWGESWVANLIAVTVAAVILALGLFGLGRWLRSEEPAYANSPDEALAA